MRGMRGKCRTWRGGRSARGYMMITSQPQPARQSMLALFLTILALGASLCLIVWIVVPEISGIVLIGLLAMAIWAMRL